MIFVNSLVVQKEKRPCLRKKAKNNLLSLSRRVLFVLLFASIRIAGVGPADGFFVKSFVTI